MRTVGGVLISLPQAMTYPTTRNVGVAFMSIPQATSQVTKSVTHDRDDRPTVTSQLPLDRYQIIQFGDRGTCA